MKTLRRLVGQSKPETREWRPMATFAAVLATPDTVAAAIRKHSEDLLGSAKQGRRHLKLFDIRLRRADQKPQDATNPLQREVIRHFKGRVAIVYREVWRNFSDDEFEVWARW
jgi:hypothetical protein